MIPKEKLIHGAFVNFVDYEGIHNPIKIHSFDGDRAVKVDGEEMYCTFDRLEGIKCSELTLLCLGFNQCENDDNILTFGKNCTYMLDEGILTLTILADLVAPDSNNKVKVNVICRCVHEIQFVLRAHRFPELKLNLLISEI